MSKESKCLQNKKWQDLIIFYEYFHSDNEMGIGASHQTGWTEAIAKLIQQRGEYRSSDKAIGYLTFA